jgi:hypothetical protein
MYEVNTDLERSKSLSGEDSTEPKMRRPELEATESAIGLSALVQRMSGPWVRASHLPDLFCSWDLAYRCTRCGWLRPIVQGKRRTIYRLADVLACMQRIEAGELPLPRRNKAAHYHGD